MTERAIEGFRLARDTPPAPAVLAWDLPTRLFKWSLVILVVTAYVSSSFDDPNMIAHKAAGYGVLTLVIYRILWGFVGGTTALFSNFLRSPGAVLAYLKARPQRLYLGHNPAGGLMVVALLAACGLQTLLGLFASDGVTASGPFASLVGGPIAEAAATLHGWWFYGILGLVAVHVAANLMAQVFKGENLIGAMITGRKIRRPYVDAPESRPGSPLAALICFIIAADIVYFGVTFAGGRLFSEF
jgi:cytochrome b